MLKIPPPLPDIQERFCFMYLNVTNRAVFAGVQIPHNAQSADCENRKHNKLIQQNK